MSIDLRHTIFIIPIRMIRTYYCKLFILLKTPNSLNIRLLSQLSASLHNTIKCYYIISIISCAMLNARAEYEQEKKKKKKQETSTIEIDDK